MTLPDAAVILRDQTEERLLHQVSYTAAQVDISKSEPSPEKLPVGWPIWPMTEYQLGSAQTKSGGLQWGVPGDKP